MSEEFEARPPGGTRVPASSHYAGQLVPRK